MTTARPNPGVVAIAAFMALWGLAAPAGALSIDEAFDRAARADPGLRAAREAARGRHESLPLALSAWLPTFEFNARYSRGDTRYRAGDGVVVSERQQGTAGLVWTQNLYRGGERSAALRQARAEVAQGHAAVEETEQAVFLRVAVAYLDMLAAGHTVRLRADALAAFDERIRDTTAQFEVGDRTRADVAQAEAEREAALAAAASARAEFDIQRALLASLMGSPPGALEAVGEPAGLPETLEAAREAALRDPPVVRAAAHALRAAEHAARRAAAAALPSIDLQGVYERHIGAIRLDGGGALSLPTLPVPLSDARLDVVLALPLYQAGAAGARLREARRTVERRRSELAAAERDAAQRAERAWRGLESARRRFSALEAAASASGVALAGIRREAEIGERSTREVLDAERALVERNIQALAARRDAIVEAYGLLDAVGALTARRLGVVGLPDLDREASDAIYKAAPVLPLFEGE